MRSSIAATRGFSAPVSTIQRSQEAFGLILLTGLVPALQTRNGAGFVSKIPHGAIVTSGNARALAVPPFRTILGRRWCGVGGEGDDWLG